PMRWDVWDSPELREDNEYYEYFHDDIFDMLLEIREDVAGVNVTEYTPEVLSEIDSNIMHNVIREQNKTPEEALKKSADTVRKQNKMIKFLNSKKVVPYVFVSPFLISFLILTLYPTIQAFIMSFQRILPGEVSFIGLSNYERIFNSTFYQALTNTTIYMILT